METEYEICNIYTWSYYKYKSVTIFYFIAQSLKYQFLSASFQPLDKVDKSKTRKKLIIS